jgi:hypothetical protein
MPACARLSHGNVSEGLLCLATTSDRCADFPSVSVRRAWSGKDGKSIMHTGRKLALVTGASSAIGLELARLCAYDGFDLMIAAGVSSVFDAAQELAGSARDRQPGAL